MRVVDFFDAVTNDRVYRKKINAKDAIMLMETKNGTWVSPRVFQMFKLIMNHES